MALISCTECGNQVSDKAASCPKCGAPVGPSESTHARTYQAAPETVAPAQLVKHAKSRGVYIILGLVFGLLGFHNFYAGRYMVGFAQLLCTCILGWFIVGLVITAVWVLVELLTVTKDGAGDEMT